MLFRQNLDVFLLVICMIFGVYGQNECDRYYSDVGICNNYISVGDSVFYANTSDVENQFHSLAVAQGLSTLRFDDSPLGDCVQNFTSFICATVFPRCDPVSNPNIVPPCLSTCTNVIESCETKLLDAPIETQEIVSTYIQSSTYYPKGCAGNIPPPFDIRYPTEKCNASPQKFNHPKCFDPFIEDSQWFKNQSVTDKNFCQLGCCLPCPQSYSLYPSNQLKQNFLVTQILRTFSVIGSGIMLISYLVLPGKRSHPNIMILFSSLSIFLYSSNVLFSIGDPKSVQCSVNGITPSDQINNPFLCGLQGALLIFSSYATAIWIAFIILSLHLHTVWNSNKMNDKYVYLNIIGWGVPLLLTVAALGNNAIDYQFATLCLVKVDLANELFFYPLGSIVVPSFVIHTLTVIHIFKVSNQGELSTGRGYSEINSHRHHVLQVIRLQWRALLLVIILLLTVIFYWLFYFIELSKLVHGTKNEDFFKNWTLCIQSGNGQDYCADNVASKFMPSQKLMFVSEILTSLIGVYLIVVFFNKTLWAEWNQWANGKFKKPSEDLFAV